MLSKFFIVPRISCAKRATQLQVSFSGGMTLTKLHREIFCLLSSCNNLLCCCHLSQRMKVADHVLSSRLGSTGTLLTRPLQLSSDTTENTRAHSETGWGNSRLGPKLLNTLERGYYGAPANCKCYLFIIIGSRIYYSVRENFLPSYSIHECTFAMRVACCDGVKVCICWTWRMSI